MLLNVLQEFFNVLLSYFLGSADSKSHKNETRNFDTPVAK